MIHITYSLVGIATDCGQMFESRNRQDFSPFHNFPSQIWGPPSLKPKCYRQWFSTGLKLTTYFHLLLRPRMVELYLRSQFRPQGIVLSRAGRSLPSRNLSSTTLIGKSFQVFASCSHRSLVEYYFRFVR